MTTAPPGWYPDAHGQSRWWDEQAWGVSASELRERRTLALLGHLALFVLPLVAAVVIRFTVGAKDAFVRHHASEAANAQLLFFVVWNAAGLFGMAYGMRLTPGPTDEIPWPFVISWLTGVGALVVCGSFSARAAIKAYRGVFYRYPQPFRLIPGALPKESRR